MDSLLDAPTVDPQWRTALAPMRQQLSQIEDFLDEEVRAGHAVLPAREHILRAFSQPMDDVKVLIVGQDPYPTPGHPIGLSFAVDRGVRPLPRSLVNIYRELETDLAIPAASHGDLSAWSAQGVMLLNRVLSVRAHSAGSHRKHGWEDFTNFAISQLVAYKREQSTQNQKALPHASNATQMPLVAVLWGKPAQELKPLLKGAAVVESAHPSPLSARRGFFDSHPFSRVNEHLVARGEIPINWRLD